MQTETIAYTYDIIHPDNTALIEKAAACLADAFTGVQVGDVFIQEPIIGYALQLLYDDFYTFTKQYIEDNAAQGYCAVALDDEQQVVGALVGDHNAFVIGEFPTFEGTFEKMNVVADVLDDIDARFLRDFEARFQKPLEDGDVMHIFLLGTRAKVNRQEVVKHLGLLLEERARKNGIKMMLAEATNPKSMRVFEKYHGLTKHVTVDGDYIVHSYKDNMHLAVIPETMADGIYIISKMLV